MTRPFHQNCGKLVKCDECRFYDWAEAVLEILGKADRVRGRQPDEDPIAFMQRCRGDEPWSAFAVGESAQRYAEFVMIPCEDAGDNGYMEEVEL